MWLNCGNCIIKLHHKAEMKEDSLLCMSKESGFWDRNCSWWRSLWKFMEMTTKDLEYNINLVEKSNGRLQRMNFNFQRNSTVGKNTVKGHCILQRNLWKEGSKDVANFTVVFFSDIPLPAQTFSSHHPDQSADIETETRPSTSKKILTCEDRDDAQTTLF